MALCSRTLVLCLGLMALLSGCSGKQAPTGPDPVEVSPLTLTGNLVSWTTDQPTRGAVRYGTSRDALDHVAYPVAAGRQDRVLKTAHEVPLLDLQSGVETFLQTVSTAAGGSRTLSSIVSITPSVGATPNQLTSTMIHIGFGDSHLITMPTTGERVLIDGGERDAAVAVAGYFANNGISGVTSALATHIHADHIGGLVGGNGVEGVLEAFDVDFFLDSPVKNFSRSAYSDARTIVDAAGPPERAVIQRGDTSQTSSLLAWDSQVQVTVLNSGAPLGYQFVGHEGTDINNESIVLLFQYGDVDFVIGGDAEQEAEASILGAFAPGELEVEYYKAHHHGLPDASRSNWISTLKPRVSFIPNTDLVWNGDLTGALSQTTARLRSIGADVYAIDDAPALGIVRGSGRQYNVTFATDGRSYEVRYELATQPTKKPSEAAFRCVEQYLDRPQIRHSP